ncbi:MAG: FAD-binding protein, partial [Candidatus Latescibacteria bacterium]|nr:FAD-binding protein [Candidatus Latescibacterota bacterium]
ISSCPANELKIRFPNIYQNCLRFGVDLTKDAIPVVPAAHYMCGGVFTDTWGRTDINGLYASGEVTSTGLHGANRLASNSLLEALVFSDRAFQDISGQLKAKAHIPDVPAWQDDGVFNTEEWVLLSHDRQEVQRLMWDYVGIVRSDFRLKRAARRIGIIAQEVDDFYKRTKVTEPLLDLRNLTTVAALTVRCALERRENRGLHYSIDCLEFDKNTPPKDTVVSAWETWGAGLPVIEWTAIMG